MTSDPIFEIGIGNATNDTKNALTVLKNGKVGLGTATPEEMLHVEGTIEVDQRIQANDAGGLELATDDGTVRLQIEDSGEVGIGTVTPNAKLHVLGEARFESAGGGSKIIIDGSTGLAQVEFQDDGVYGAGIGYSLGRMLQRGPGLGLAAGIPIIACRRWSDPIVTGRGRSGQGRGRLRTAGDG